MSNIYVVTTGSYSEYDIKGVFDNEGLANNYALQWCDSRIETYQLNPANPYADKIANGYKYFQVHIDSGEVKYCYVIDFDTWGDSEIENYSPELGGAIMALSKDEARQIAADRYAKWKYESEVMPTVQLQPNNGSV